MNTLEWLGSLAAVSGMAVEATRVWGRSWKAAGPRPGTGVGEEPGVEAGEESWLEEEPGEGDSWPAGLEIESIWEEERQGETVTRLVGWENGERVDLEIGADGVPRQRP